MKQTTVLVSALMVVGLVSFPSFAAMRMVASKVPQAREFVKKEYLSETNRAMEQALNIHNLMNEMSDLKVSAQTLKKIGKQSTQMSQFLKKVNSCNAQKLGDIFKDPQAAWDKMMYAYEQQRQGASEKTNNNIFQPMRQKQEQELAGWTMGRSIMMDVYENPEKWGETQKDASLPLWKDQSFLFEKQWNQFYDNLNTAYGVSVSGRPSIDEETRHNPKKYDQVLAAHNAYVKQISKGKKVSSNIAKAVPPKAPAPLPKWQDIVRVDKKGNLYPEMPEPWKQMSENQFQNYSPDGEMAEFFEGKSLKPTARAIAGGESDLEKEYTLSLATDALEKGFIGSASSQKEMMQPVIQKMVKLGITVPDLDINNEKQYSEIFKKLKELKKQSIAEAYDYVQKLEKQDKENPKLVENRRKLALAQKSKLPVEAQSMTTDLNAVLQDGMMSPTNTQRLVLQALEKDENALVYLTETNAVNVDQMIREKRATDKLIAESQQQYDYTIKKQEEALSSINGCSF